MKLLIVSADRTDRHGGACNLGDAFLTDAMIDALRSRGHEAVAYDFGAPRTTDDGSRLHGGRIAALHAAIRASDAVIIGGGTMLQDDQPSRLVGGLPRLCATVTSLARSARTPVRFFGVGCDTVERRVPRLLLRYAVGRSPVWVRERESLERFSAMFSRSASLGADAALLARDLPATASPVAGRQGEQPAPVIALNRTEAARLDESEVLRMTESAPPLFLSMDQQVELADAGFLAPDVSARLAHTPTVIGWREAAATIASSSLVVASRMHALYLAALLDVPMVAVGDREKVRAFATEFAIPRIALGDYEPGLARRVDGAAFELATRRATESLDDLLVSLAADRS